MCKRLHSSGKLILHKRLFFENGALKMLFRHVWYFHFSNFNMDFVRQIFKLNPKFCCETKCCILATIDSNMVLLWILTEIEKKFACLVFLNWRHMRYSVFVLSRICANSYFIITNQSYIHWLFTKHGSATFIFPILTWLSWQMLWKNYQFLWQIFKSSKVGEPIQSPSFVQID